jgi:hypothetical protein
MKRRGIVRGLAIVVLVSFLSSGCAGMSQVMQRPGEAAALCGVGGAATGAAAGALGGRGDWRAVLIGAAAGALIGAATCWAIAEYNSRQVRDYEQTRQAIAYDPGQGESLQITHYVITPAAAAPGTEVAFNATYHVMTPNPGEDVTIVETRALKVFDPATNEYRLLGEVPNRVTVKLGTRQADGKFGIPSGATPGRYQVVFKVAKAARQDVKELALAVTRDQTVLAAASNQTAEIVAGGAKAPAPIASPERADGPAVANAVVAPKAAETAPAATTLPAATPLAALGESNPAPPKAPPSPAPPTTVAAAVPVKYFVASKIDKPGNLRNGPGPTHKVVGTIAPGERHLIVDRHLRSGEKVPWYKIRLDSGVEVWVAGSLGTESDE